VKMRVLLLLSVWILAPLTSLAAPSSICDFTIHDEGLNKRDNLCSLKTPPVLCQPNSSVTVEETAQWGYKFYRAFVVDGGPKTMFSLIDSTYKVSNSQHHFKFTLSSYITHSRKERLNFEHAIATPSRVLGWTEHHLAPFLQREQDRNRARHRLVLCC
jgi:hypothetical protein